MSDQLLLQDFPVPTDLLIPDEIIEHDGFTFQIFEPKQHDFDVWLREVDEHVLDMTGYSVHQFAVVPTFGGWHEWPVDPQEAATAVLRQDAWGQSFLGDLDLE